MSLIISMLIGAQAESSLDGCFGLHVFHPIAPYLRPHL
jgi:hypothetical protein